MTVEREMKELLIENPSLEHGGSALVDMSDEELNEIRCRTCADQSEQWTLTCGVGGMLLG